MYGVRFTPWSPFRSSRRSTSTRSTATSSPPFLLRDTGQRCARYTFGVLLTRDAEERVCSIVSLCMREFCCDEGCHLAPITEPMPTDVHPPPSIQLLLARAVPVAEPRWCRWRRGRSRRLFGLRRTGIQATRGPTHRSTRWNGVSLSSRVPIGFAKLTSTCLNLSLSFSVCLSLARMPCLNRPLAAR